MEITAAQAKRLSSKNNVSRHAKMDLENIYKQIRKAAESGSTEVTLRLKYVDKTYTEKVKNDLADKGFTTAQVKVVSASKNKYTEVVVSW